MITVAIAEDEAAVTRKLTNMAQDGKTWEKMKIQEPFLTKRCF